MLSAAGCGGDISTPWNLGNPSAPIINPGGTWQDPCPSPTPTPAPSVTPSPSPLPSSSPQPQPSWWCKTFPWWPWCPKALDEIGVSKVRFSSTCTPGPSIHNTNYCQVDNSGNILSTDQIYSNNENDGVHFGGGGCISRPIKDVWGVYFNVDAMKPDDVDEYNSTPRPDLVPAGSQIVFVYDLYNQHNVPLINPSWTVRWYYSVTFGTFETPDEVAIKYQKVDGTSYITSMYGGYVLDRVTDNITSWVSDEFVNATQYDKGKGYNAVVEDYSRFRNAAPELPPQPMLQPSQ